MIQKLTLLFSLLLISSTSFSGSPTPVSLPQFESEINLETARKWIAPNYDSQESALGWGKNAFGIPPGMEQRVSFWLDIYTKFSSQQGLLHDSRYVHIVYQPLDFTDINSNESLTDGQKRKARRKLVKDKKRKIKERLLRLNSLTNKFVKNKDESSIDQLKKAGASLDEEDIRYLHMFEKVTEKNKFKIASRKGRLRFQLGQKDHFVKGIYFSGRYLDEMEDIFRERGLPIELTRLPFVESSFNLKARSKVGASGIWQFMRSTGRMYMKIDAVVDERNEPLKATESAAKMLRSNFNMLGSWPLAVTAYNHGPSGMRRLVRRYKTKDLEEIVKVRRGRFGFASANFYASFLAALIAEKRADKFYGVVYKERLVKHKKIVLSKRIGKQTLLDIFSGNKKQAKEFNPHLSKYFWQGYRSLPYKRYILVPEETYDTAKVKIKESKESLPDLGKGTKYVIRRGDTLSEIARNFGVSLGELKALNGIDNPRRIRFGQKLVIPGK